MATILQNYISNTAATITLVSLANSSGRASTAIDNTATKAISADIRVKVTTSGTLASGFVSVYLIRSDDGTNYDDAFAGTDAAYTPINAILLGILSTPATSTYVKVFDTAELGLTLPQKYSIGIVNSSGNALTATAGNHSVTIEAKSFTIV